MSFTTMFLIGIFVQCRQFRVINRSFFLASLLLNFNKYFPTGIGNLSKIKVSRFQFQHKGNNSSNIFFMEEKELQQCCRSNLDPVFLKYKSFSAGGRIELARYVVSLVGDYCCNNCFIQLEQCFYYQRKLGMIWG